MRYRKHAGVALVALFVVALGVWAIPRALGTGSQPTPSDGTLDPLSTAPHTTVSLAKFSIEGTLDNCADVTFWAKREIDAKKLEARGFVLLKSPCSKTFPNGVAIASCTRSDLDGDAQPSVLGVGYYYDVATVVGDDTYRGQCLGTGGSWAVKSPEGPQSATLRAKMDASKPHHEFDSLMELAP
jgi:hypothetical protein